MNDVGAIRTDTVQGAVKVLERLPALGSETPCAQPAGRSQAEASRDADDRAASQRSRVRMVGRRGLDDAMFLHAAHPRSRFVSTESVTPSVTNRRTLLSGRSIVGLPPSEVAIASRPASPAAPLS